MTKCIYSCKSQCPRGPTLCLGCAGTPAPSRGVCSVSPQVTDVWSPMLQCTLTSVVSVSQNGRVHPSSYLQEARLLSGPRGAPPSRGSEFCASRGDKSGSEGRFRLPLVTGAGLAGSWVFGRDPEAEMRSLLRHAEATAASAATF